MIKGRPIQAERLTQVHLPNEEDPLMSHQAQAGETLSQVAQDNGLTLAQLLDANPQFAADPDNIHASSRNSGRIPGGQEQAY